MLKDIISYLALIIVLKGIDQEMVENKLKEVIGEKSSIEDFSPEELISTAAILSKYAAA